MGIFTDKFISNFNESGSLSGTLHNNDIYDIGYELCNISSLALNECMNRQSLLESTGVDPDQQRILEAQMDVLLEFSVKDIWEKIKAAFRWLWEQIKKAGAWIKGLFTKGKAKETEKNLDKAKEELKKNPEKGKISMDPELAKTIEKTADELKMKLQAAARAIENKQGEEVSVAANLAKAINDAKSKLPDEEKAAANATATFYKIVFNPDLYFEPDYFINFGFAGNVTAAISKFTKALDSFENNNIINARTKTTGNIDSFKSTLTEIDMDNMSILSNEFIKEYPWLSKQYQEKNGNNVNMNAALPRYIRLKNLENMKEQSKKIDKSSESGMQSMINWLNNKIAIVNNNHAVSIKNLHKRLEEQIAAIEKGVMGSIESFKTKTVTYKRKNPDREIEYNPTKIKYMQDNVTQFLSILRNNLAIMTIINKNVGNTLVQLNIASRRICSLFGISQI